MNPDDTYIRDRLILHGGRGTVTFVFQAAPVFQEAAAGLEYRADGERRTLTIAGPNAALEVNREYICWERSDDRIRLRWFVYLGADLEVILEAQNIGAGPVSLDRLAVLDVRSESHGAVNLGAGPQRWAFYKHGWQSWSPTFARHIGDGVYINPGGAEYDRKHTPHPGSGTEDFQSEWFTVLHDRDGGLSALLGFTDGRRALSDVALHLDGRALRRLAATCYADGVVLEPGERFLSEPLLVTFADDDPLRLLEHYADRVASRMGARVPDSIPTGWCTWYYFYGENSAEDVLANAAQIRKHRLPLEYVLIDDGYQQAIGDWLRIDAVKFPQGMRAVADGIRAAGLRPGIWLAPFGVSSESATYAEHPEWTLKYADGSPVIAWQHWGVNIYALDLTRADVLDWITHVFRVMSEEWGYDLFKIDFVFAAAMEGIRHDPRVTRAEAYRRGIEHIRGVIGERFLLGCGAPQLPSVGVVDAMRIGPDVAFNWTPIWADLSAPAVANALRNTAARYFMHRRWWLNDGDCVLVRTRGDQSDLVLNEMRTLVTGIALSGGLMLDSDNLPTIRPGRLKYLKMALPPSGIAARPVDLFRSENPRAQVLRVDRPWGAWWVVSLMNWRDKTTKTEVTLRELGLPEGEYHVYNFWRQRYVGVRSDRLMFRRHQPHESIVLCLKPASDQPDLLTSTFHVTQGAAEIAGVQRIVHGPSGQTLRVDLRKAGVQRGQLIFVAPAPWRASEARVDGRKWPFRVLASGLVAVRFRVKEQALVELDFVRDE